MRYFAKHKGIIALSLFLSLLSTSALLAWVSTFRPTGLVGNDMSKKDLDYKGKNYSAQWLGCQSLVDAIVDEERIYVGCINFVWIVDRDSGMVVESLTTSNALGDYTVTDLELIGNNLFVGTQDGFTKYDLTTAKSENISVEEGLVNGANIYFTRDGDILWVATFDGISRYDTKTGEIENFKSVLSPNSTKFNTKKIITTSKAVYATITANAYSSGAIARYDKGSGQWSSFGTTDFPSQEQDRLDIFEIASVGDKIVVAEHDKVWVGEDSSNTRWLLDETLLPRLKELSGQEYVSIRIKGVNGNRIFVLVGSTFYSYDISSGEVSYEYDFQIPSEFSDEGTSFFNVSPFDYFNEGFLIYDTTEYGGDVLDTSYVLERFNVATGEKVHFNINGKIVPPFFPKAAVNDNLLGMSSGGLVLSYSPPNNGFSVLGQTDYEVYGDSSTFYPIKGTSSAIVVSQECGQGCNEPRFSLLDYGDKSLSEIELPTDIAEVIKSESEYFTSYMSMNSSVIVEDGLVIWQHFVSQDEEKYIVFNETSKSFEYRDDLPDGLEEESVWDVACPYVFTYNDQLGFSGQECKTSYEVDGAKYTLSDDKEVFYIESQGEKTSQSILQSPDNYSPFDSVQSRTIASSIWLVDGKIWFKTQNGVSQYDPSNKKWRVFGSKEGFINNWMFSAFVTSKYLFLGSSGSFSVIEY